MLAKRIIPCLDVKDGRVVKGRRFVDLRDAGDPVALAARYDHEGADELVFLDITASAERRRTVVDLAAQVAGARRGVEHGAGEILLTSMDRDGTRDGFELELTALVADAVRVPVIASGGAGEAAHFVELFARTGAEAGLAASIFHSGEIAVGVLKEDLAARGVPVRPSTEAR